MAGTVLGRLRVVGRLGAGGMGEVWRAEDPKLQRTVAVKRVSICGTGDRDEAARLLREGQRLSALNHPNIASVYDVLEQDDQIFLVMEYVEGQTLRLRLNQPINLNQFFDIALQCADALTAAHERGILHSDVKPENVMITESGQVKLLDFGVARRLAGEARQTAQQRRRSRLPLRWAELPATWRLKCWWEVYLISEPISFHSVWCFTKCWEGGILSSERPPR